MNKYDGVLERAMGRDLGWNEDVADNAKKKKEREHRIDIECISAIGKARRRRELEENRLNFRTDLDAFEKLSGETKETVEKEQEEVREEVREDMRSKLKYNIFQKEQEEFYSLPTPLRQAFCHAMVIESMLVKAIIEGTMSKELAQMVLEIMEQTISIRDIILDVELKNYEEKNRN